MPENTPLVLRQDAGAVAILTLNRPDTRNSLSRAMIAALHGALETVGAEPGIRCVVLAAEGRAFSAGHDLKEVTAHRSDADGGAGFFAAIMAECAAMMQAVTTLPQPVVAAVEGIATAAGCQLAASCDLVVASESAKFCTPGVDIGLFCSTPGVALARAVPRKAAMEMLLLGEMVPAGEAHRMGLVNRVVPAGQALAEAEALAQRIAARSAVALRMGKRGFNAQAGLPLDRAYEEAGRVMVENLLAADAEEGIGAFLGKRKPSWQHR
ncbi:enoyl-CoA hydratase [Siccirubricoccus sp. KC 17139]|uniref:Enoyl-CoA hydratase domain-containing protein 3, mitochondrial n=1 Tax=Siccirubricoccus soli TaxID=2899147 RepID=A0ABT1D0L0_9PROT|nr:enoyl-CoA hydratase [Siccirubricoccus soli]MCO6415449.1 enoyl-CoA hydratase [Siccirubricoccus soli]MCP2681581.1 enoyl-CoA hydratase [Siccirubricoccus soli]